MTGNTLTLVVIVMLLCGGSAAAQYEGPDQCRTCHQLMEDTPSKLFENDIHARKGITCAGCHGGDATKDEMEEAMNTKAGFIGVPKGNAISEACAKCHSDSRVMVRQYGSRLPLDQIESLRTSVHGQQSAGAQSNIAQCTSCHGAHGILPKTNRRSPVNPLNVAATCSKCHQSATFMRVYNPALPVDQMSKYRTSVHGRRNAAGDVKVAECASCHGSHEILAANDVRSRVYPTNVPQTCAECHANPEYMRGYGIPSDQFAKYSESVHGKALLERDDVGAPACNDCHGNHGATPPGVASISKVCGTCHALNAELFSSSPHKKAFDAQGLPECETCHGYHDVVAATNRLLGVGEGAVCAWCHGGDPDSKAYRVAGLMRTLIDSLESAEEAATERVDEAEQKGMEIADARFQLREVRQARLEARTKVHSFNEDEFKGVTDKGMAVAATANEEAVAAIDEYYYRRWGLLIASLIMTFLGVSLYMYIRRIDREQRQK